MNNLRALRKANGLRQIDVAKRLSVDQGAVSKWETGETVPLRKHRNKLAKLFEVSVESLGFSNQDSAGG